MTNLLCEEENIISINKDESVSAKSDLTQFNPSDLLQSQEQDDLLTCVKGDAGIQYRRWDPVDPV